MKTLKLKTEEMHCPSCEMLIEMSLSEIDGIYAVNASYPNDSVEVEYDPEKVAETSIASLIIEAGYKIKKIEEE